MNKKLYQLCIYKQFGEYERDTLWQSRLYSSKEASQNGCANVEIFDIAQTVYDETDDKDDDVRAIYHTEIDIEKTCKTGSPEAIRFVEKVKKWLHANEGNYYIEPRPMSDDEPIFWEVQDYVVATE